MFYLMEDEEFIKVVEEHPKLYPVILVMKRMRELKISGLFYVKLVLLLCGHLHIIKTDKILLTKGDVLYGYKISKFICKD